MPTLEQLKQAMRPNQPKGLIRFRALLMQAAYNQEPAQPDGQILAKLCRHASHYLAQNQFRHYKRLLSALFDSVDSTNRHKLATYALEYLCYLNKQEELNIAAFEWLVDHGASIHNLSPSSIYAVTKGTLFAQRLRMQYDQHLLEIKRTIIDYDQENYEKALYDSIEMLLVDYLKYVEETPLNPNLFKTLAQKLLTLARGKLSENWILMMIQEFISNSTFGYMPECNPPAIALLELGLDINEIFCGELTQTSTEQQDDILSIYERRQANPKYLIKLAMEQFDEAAAIRIAIRYCVSGNSCIHEQNSTDTLFIIALNHHYYRLAEHFMQIMEINSLDHVLANKTLATLCKHANHDFNGKLIKLARQLLDSGATANTMVEGRLLIEHAIEHRNKALIELLLPCTPLHRHLTHNDEAYSCDGAHSCDEAYYPGEAYYCDDEAKNEPSLSQPVLLCAYTQHYDHPEFRTWLISVINRLRPGFDWSATVIHEGSTKSFAEIEAEMVDREGFLKASRGISQTEYEVRASRQNTLRLIHYGSPIVSTESSKRTTDDYTFIYDTCLNGCDIKHWHVVFELLSKHQPELIEPLSYRVIDLQLYSLSRKDCYRHPNTHLKQLTRQQLKQRLNQISQSPEATAIKWLLQNNYCQPTQACDTSTIFPVRPYLEFLHMAIMQHLGVDINQANNQGNTIMHQVAKRNCGDFDLEIARALMRLLDYTNFSANNEGQYAHDVAFDYYHRNLAAKYKLLKTSLMQSQRFSLLDLRQLRKQKRARPSAIRPPYRPNSRTQLFNAIGRPPAKPSSRPMPSLTLLMPH